MAQSRTKQYEIELLEVIKKHKIAFFDHAFAFVSFSRSTAYEHELDKSDDIKNAIAQNRVKAKNYMLNKWIAGDNATLQVAAYRLCATPEEHKLLNQQYIDHTSGGDKIKPQITAQSKEEADKINSLLSDFDSDNANDE